MCEQDATGATALVDSVRGALGNLDLAQMDDTERLGFLRAAEDLTRSLAAVTVRAQVAFAESQVAEQAAAGVPARKRGLAVADDIAAARRTSPSMGSRELTSAKALATEMPLTLQALADATINAYQARMITEATTCLDRADRAEVDERLQAALPGASNAEIGKAVRALVYEVDPAGFVRRARKAAADRGVSVRPAPDVMALLSARLPAPQAIACYTALRSHAVTARASGDPRSLNQLMADELVHRLTGRTVVDGIDVEVGLVMTDSALFDGASDPADLEGYGPIPAEMARDLLRHERSDADGHTSCGDEAHEPDAQPSDQPERLSARSSDASEESCPDSTRCSSWDCSKLHGVPPAAAHPGRAAGGHEPPGDGSPGTPSSDGMPRADGAARPDDPPPADHAARPGDPPPADHAARPGDVPPAEGRPPAAEAADGATAAKAWVRRLYVDPATGVLTGRDLRRRLFTGSLRAFVIARDRTCRNSWCGAPIRDIDHIRRHRDGGTTDADNGRGLCHRCNLARERERHHEPPPGSYRGPPPAANTLLGRRAPRAPTPGAAAALSGSDPPAGAYSPTESERDVA